MGIPIPGKTVFILYWDGPDITDDTETRTSMSNQCRSDCLCYLGWGAHQCFYPCSTFVVVLLYRILWYIGAEATWPPFPDNIFKCIFKNENVWISVKISLEFIPTGPINNIPAMVQIMALRRLGNKPLSEPIMVSLLTHICVTRPRWVNETWLYLSFHRYG